MPIDHLKLNPEQDFRKWCRVHGQAIAIHKHIIVRPEYNLHHVTAHNRADLIIARWPQKDIQHTHIDKAPEIIVYRRKLYYDANTKCYETYMHYYWYEDI